MRYEKTSGNCKKHSTASAIALTLILALFAVSCKTNRTSEANRVSQTDTSAAKTVETAQSATKTFAYTIVDTYYSAADSAGNTHPTRTVKTVARAAEQTAAETTAQQTCAQHTVSVAQEASTEKKESTPGFGWLYGITVVASMVLMIVWYNLKK